MMDDLKHLEREVELLKEIVELKTKLLEIDRSFQQPYPTYPTYPAYPSYKPYDDWWKPTVSWCDTGMR